ncbi:hypothetical protein OPV22_013387 [Ensete ventricosum]|uniref:GDSL esterase/lipase n=1 Tax=Ensete ventricosum TaxID=4639 RepID=A0AAV8R4U3_ENSVE|nr:hypothetical protein OPV22_013387 [Ensete ventricosum]
MPSLCSSTPACKDYFPFRDWVLRDWLGMVRWIYWYQGCFPVYLTLYASSNKNDYTGVGCLRKYNDLALHHNALLRRAIYGLQRKHHGTRIRYADYYNPPLRFAADPAKYGFTGGGALRATGSGEYNVNPDKVCAQPGSSVCGDPTTHVSWDGSHVTEAACRLIARGWLRGPDAKPPIIRQPPP